MLCEYLVRAFQMRFMELHHTAFPAFDLQQERRRHMEQDGFIMIDRFVEALRAFENSGLSFEAFYLSCIDELLS